jgi:hypothetical protein
MADIHVVPKGRSNMWLWIIAIVVVVGLLTWWLGRSSGARSTTRSVPMHLHAAQSMARDGHTGGEVFSGRRFTII